MPSTHDGISCALAPSPVWIGVGLALLGAGAWLGFAGTYVVAVALVVVGLLVLVNQKGQRRVRVLATKLLVEDERLLRALLIGPARSRVEWKDVRSVRIDGGALRLDTDGAPFVTAQGASREDLETLAARADAALAKDRAERAEAP